MNNIFLRRQWHLCLKNTKTFRRRSRRARNWRQNNIGKCGLKIFFIIYILQVQWTWYDTRLASSSNWRHFKARRGACKFLEISSFTFLKTRVTLKVARNLVTEDPRLMMKRAAVEFRQSHLKTVSWNKLQYKESSPYYNPYSNNTMLTLIFIVVLRGWASIIQFQ